MAAFFTGLFRVRLTSPMNRGDSGSPLLVQTGANTYKMVGVLFVIANGNLTDGYNTAIAFPASVAESALGITFGKREPIARAGEDQTVALGAPVMLDGSESEDRDYPDRDLSYFWSQILGSPHEGIESRRVEIQNANAAEAIVTAPSVLPVGRDFTTIPMRLTVIDSYDRINVDVVEITVRKPPVARAIASPKAVAIDGGTVQLIDTSSIGDSLKYSWEQNPGDGSKVSIERPKQSVASFNAPSAAAALSFTLTVTDKWGLSDTDTVTVLVRKPPVAVATADPPIGPGGTIVTLSAADSEGEELTYQWSEVPDEQEGGLSDYTAESPTFVIPPGAAVDTVYTFILTVRDKWGLTATDTVSVTVGEAVNRAPVANAGADQMVTVGDLVTLDGGSSTDPEGAGLRRSSRVHPRPAGESRNSGSLFGHPPEFLAGGRGVGRLGRYRSHRRPGRD